MANIIIWNNGRLMLLLIGLATNYLILSSLELSLASSMAIIDNMTLGEISTIKNREVI